MKSKIIFLMCLGFVVSGIISACSRKPLAWSAVGEDGFGEAANRNVTSLAVFKGNVYAGVFNNAGDGAGIWRWNGEDWVQVNSSGFDAAQRGSTIMALYVYDGMLYAGVSDWLNNNEFSGQIWRTGDGKIWEAVDTQGFGSPGNFGFSAFAKHDDMLYAASSNNNGVEIWRSSSGDSGSWERAAGNGFGDSWNIEVTSLVVYKGWLYAAIQTQFGSETARNKAAQVWRSKNGTAWQPVVDDGFGDLNNKSVGGFVVFKDVLYLGTMHYDPVTQLSEGAQIWMTRGGEEWQPAMVGGFGDSGIIKVESLVVFEGQLYAIAWGRDPRTAGYTGLQVWASADGMTWTQVSEVGFGDPCNISTLWANATLVYENSLLIGTWNRCGGGEIWRFGQSG